MGNGSWVYHTPNFESDKLNPEMMIYSPWSGHRRFAYDFVANLKPACIVELGSYYGCSAFTFLQALKDQRINASFYAIDTWAGDSFTENDYREDIFDSYKKIQEQCFSEQDAYMLQMTFDQANSNFADYSIDLLHIDGSHTYKDCHHDFETWLPKVKEDGVILFHDISDDKLDGELLGSHLFWKEIKEKYPYTMEFRYSFGLGILLFNEKLYRNIRSAFDFDYYQQLENHASVINKDIIRKQYFELRDTKKYIEFLQSQLSISQSNVHEYEKTQEQKDSYIRDLEMKNKDLTEICRNEETEISKINAIYEENLSGYQTDIAAKDAFIEELRSTVQKYKETVEGKNQYISDLEESIELFKHNDSEKQKYVEELSETIQKYKDTVRSKDQYIADLEDSIASYKQVEVERQKYIKNLESEIKHLNQTIREMMEDIKRVNDERNSAVEDYKGTLEEKESYISELLSNVSSMNILLRKKENYEEELKQDLHKYEITVSGKDRYINELLETIKKYVVTVEGKEKYIKELLNKITELKQDVHIFETECREAKRKLEDVEYKSEDKEARICELEAEIKKMMLEIRISQDKILCLRQEKEMLVKNLADIRKQLSKLPFGKIILDRMEMNRVEVQQ